MLSLYLTYVWTDADCASAVKVTVSAKHMVFFHNEYISESVTLPSLYPYYIIDFIDNYFWSKIFSFVFLPFWYLDIFLLNECINNLMNKYIFCNAINFAINDTNWYIIFPPVTCLQKEIKENKALHNCPVDKNGRGWNRWWCVCMYRVFI